MNLQLEKSALKSLQSVKSSSALNALKKALSELSKKGLQSSNVKALSGVKNGFRKRVGRHRVLFTLESDQTIKVWLIEIEKDTKKDYQKWVGYIAKKLSK